MEREFSLSIFVKMLKKFWYILLIAVIVGAAAGAVYAVVLSEDTWSVDASVRVTIEYLDRPITNVSDGEASMFNQNTAGDWTKIYNKIFSKSFDDMMVETLVEDYGYTLESGDNTDKIYKLSTANSSYHINITMSDRDNALEVGQVFIDYVLTELETPEVKNIVATYTGIIEPMAFAAKVNPDDSSSAMSWYIGLFIGMIGGIALYFVLVLVLYFYNPKLQSVEEFNTQFDIQVLEGDSNSNGLLNAAIKVRLALGFLGGTKTIAVNNTFDARSLAEGLSVLGDKVLVTDLYNLKDSTIEKGEFYDVLKGEEIEISDIDNAIASFKTDYEGTYDYVIIVASPYDFRKDYLMIADSTDGAMLKLDMNNTYKAIKARINEICTLENINLIGVVF